MFCNVVVAQNDYYAAKQTADAGNYVDAVEQYKKALRDTQDPIKRQELFYNIGISFLKMNRYAEAMPWLRDAVHSNSPYVKHYFAYADALTFLGEISRASEIYKKVLKNYPDNKYANTKLYSLNSFEIDFPRVLTVKEQQNINSFYSDYSPAWFGDKLVFSSSRPGKYKNDNKRTAQAYSDLYTASYNSFNDLWESPVAFDAMNSRHSEGVFTYDNLYKSAFVMKCFNKEHSCKIMASSQNSDGSWSKLTEVAFDGKQKMGHPAFSNDGNSLYFVSDMKGGYGGKDIWVINRIERDIWGMPKNLGSDVNSSEDEMFPSVVGDSLLFFASDRPGSIGGLDIYLSKIDGIKYNSAVHLQYPINTTADDFSLIMNSKGGLFTSNRENEARSDDIYSFTGFPLQIKLHGVVYDKEYGGTISGAEVALKFGNAKYQLDTDSLGRFSVAIPIFTKGSISINHKEYKEVAEELFFNDSKLLYKQKDVYRDYYLAPPQPLAKIVGVVTNRETNEPIIGQTVTIAGSRGFKTSVKTNEKGKYTFKDLLPKRIYTVKIQKEGYFSDSRQCKVPALSVSMSFCTATGYDMDFQLTEIQQKKEVVIRNIFYDFNKASLRSESRNELKKLASMLTETPNVIIQINSHTDVRGRDAYNLRLSQRRAQSVVDYLTRNGISAERLFARGFGESKPILKNAATEDEHQLNRRTSFRVLAILEKSSSQMPDKMPSVIIEQPVIKKQKAPVETIVEIVKPPISGLSYCVQLFSSNKKMTNDAHFSVLISNTSNTRLIEHKVGGVYKYEIGERSTYSKAVALRTKIVSLGHKDCFITAYRDGKKISVNSAIKMEKK